MEKHFWLLFALVCAWMYTLSAYSQNRGDNYLFTHLTMDEGLPKNYVEDVMKDSRGFLWISTGGDGVTRYDGYEFLTFSTFSEGTRLKNNVIVKFCEDRFGRIWMAGEQGLDILDVASLKLVEPQTLGDKFSVEMFHSASFVYCSTSGNIWLGADDALYKIFFSPDGKVERIMRICELYLYNRSLAFCEADGYIWFDYLGTLSLIKESVNTPQKPLPVFSGVSLPPNTVMLCLFPWQDDLWVGTNMGLFRYNVRTGILKSYFFNEHDPNSLSQSYVTDINLTPDGILVIGTLKGLNLYNAVSDNFTRVLQSELSGNVSGLNCNFINCLLADDDMLWIGTEVGGLNKMFISRLQIQNDLYSPEDPGSISGNLVNAVLEEENGTLWIGTVEAGLNLRRAGQRRFEHYTTEAPAHLSHNSVSALASDGKGRIYVGTWGGGFGWVNGSNLADKTFHPILSDGIPGLSRAFVSVLLYDSVNDLLWIGTNREILVYNSATGQVSDPFRGKRRGNVYGSLGGCVTPDGSLWMGVTSGLYQINLHTYGKDSLEYRLYDYKLDDPSERLPERITSICPSKDGCVWIATTNGNGFYRAEEKNGEWSFKAFTTEDGLINNNVIGVWEDKDGYVWLTTNNGLSCFNPKEGIFQNYTKHDGLLSNQFYWNAIGGSKDGKVYVGSTQGFSEIRFVPRAESDQSFPLAFTGILCFDRNLPFVDNQVKIHEREKRLTICFSSLDYNPSALACYSYRLKGFDDNWITLPANQHTVSYTNLRPGKYVFELQYASDGKRFISPVQTLSIEVTPYFYKTVWFKVLVILLVLIVIYGRFRSLKHQQKLLHTMVEERTRKLEEQKKLLSDQTEELSHQNKLLKESNEKITSQKNKILEMSRKVEELTFDKLTFFTNITHEFRTPLTLIIGPIERALKLSYNPQVIEQLHLVERNSKYLLSLINQLLDFRKVEEGQVKIVSNYGNIRSFIEEFMPSFMDYAQARGIDLRCYVRLQNPFMMFAEDILRKILTNLISNALKFTPKGGNVSVYVASLSTAQGEQLFIGVNDTGKGIPQEDIDRIFNRFYQADNQNQASVSGQSGTGIGLYLCRKLVTLLSGSIKAKNKPAGGSVFRVLVPIVRGENKQTITEKTEEIHPELLRNSKLTMLVVEDNKDMRDYTRSILREYYNVLEASDGEEALRVLKDYPVDFIISDLMMPVMDGVELLHRVRSDFSISHIPFLMLTAKTSDEARLESYKMGVDAYLLKPFDENMLLARIASILENRKRFQQRFSIEMNVDALEIPEENSGDKKFLEKAIKIVKEHYKNPDFEVSDFITEIGISKSLLNKKMQTLTGQSAGQFIRNYRLNLAHELLLKNKVSRAMNISEIAYAVGFNDPKYFTRCFTKHFNVTPSSLMEG